VSAPLLEVRDLRTWFHTDAGTAKAVDGVSFAVERGEVLGIVGESGCGKSVTSLSLMQLIARPPGEVMSGSSIRWKGEELVGAKEKRLRALRGDDIAMIFQEPMTSLNPVHRVGAQIAEVLRLHRGMNAGEARARAVELLSLVGIPNADERVDAYPHHLSGGQRQRVMIAIALACEPDLLIADEPTTALDVTIQAQILDLLEELRESHGTAMILITHDMGVVAEAADDVIVMYAGQIVEQASVLDLFDHPEHPYTEALLGALPQLEGDGIRQRHLTAIPGRPPDLRDPPENCRFAARCKYAGGDACTTRMPELREIRPGHFVRSEHPASERTRRAETVPA
jgi:peptide/nickel transport system ATP-binding protein